MPTWLVHGFRWPRAAIHIHIILENLEDCAGDWLMAPDTTAQLTENLQKQYPDQLKHLPGLRFIEQYDVEDETTKGQPFAYVCDQVHEVRLGVDVDDVRGRGVQSEAWTALVELRDKLAPGAKVGWYVVVNGDVERWAPPLDDEEEEEEEEETETESNTDTRFSVDETYEAQPGSVSQYSSTNKSEEDGESRKKGLKKWLGKIKKGRR